MFNNSKKGSLCTDQICSTFGQQWPKNRYNTVKHNGQKNGDEWKIYIDCECFTVHQYN